MLSASTEELKERIERSSRNLALADSPDHFKIVAQALDSFNDQLATLDRERDRLILERQTQAEAAGTLQELIPLRKHLRQADRIRLAVALPTMIESIYIWRRQFDTRIPGYLTCRGIFGELRFREGVVGGS